MHERKQRIANVAAAVAAEALFAAPHAVDGEQEQRHADVDAERSVERGAGLAVLDVVDDVQAVLQQVVPGANRDGVVGDRYAVGADGQVQRRQRMRERTTAAGHRGDRSRALLVPDDRRTALLRAGRDGFEIVRQTVVVGDRGHVASQA